MTSVSDARAVILGCSGTTLTPEESAFFRDVRPWGFILFKRNIGTPDEVRALTAALRDTVGRSDAPILIDQEGGRVQRMGPPHWPKYPSGRRIGALPLNLARLGARLMAHDLFDVGINVDCAPMLDVPVAGSDDIVGDRAFGTDPEAVIATGRAVAEGLMAGGVLPVIKHMPGHGRATCDSHLALPEVAADRAQLADSDFRPFRALADLPLAMSAHVTFTAIDPERPATLSPTVIREIVRHASGLRSFGPANPADRVVRHTGERLAGEARLCRSKPRERLNAREALSPASRSTHRRPTARLPLDSIMPWTS